MNDIQRRLRGCFAAVFEHLPEVAIASARVDSVKGWDSIATVTLVALVEEEFAIQIAPRDLQQLTSFHAFASYLEAAA